MKNDYVVICKDGEFKAKTKEVEQGSSAEWDYLYDFVANHNLAVQENYEVVCSMIDLDSFIDYYCTQVFIDSGDCSETKNVLEWKSAQIDKNNPYMDGKWRWALYDINNSIREVDRDNFNEIVWEGRPAFGDHRILKALFDNVKFRQRFINTMMDLMNKNFRSDNVLPRLKLLADAISVSEKLHSERFHGDDKFLIDFYEETDKIEDFFRERPTYVADMRQERFGLEEPVTIEISSENAGSSYFQLNSIEVDNADGIWQGNYFVEVPISLSAMESNDRIFLKWLITEEGQTKEIADQSIEFYPKSEMEIKALYQGK